MKQLLPKSPFLTFIFLIANLFFATVSFGQTVSLDQADLDYAPGETVYITGTGWHSNEIINLQVDHLSQPIPDHGTPDPHLPWTVEADSSGNFTASWVVTEYELGANLLLNADGLLSGYTYKVFFTDGQRDFNSLTVGSQAGTATYGTAGSPTFLVTVFTTASGGGTSNLGPISLSITGLPVGAIPTFSPVSPLSASDTTPNPTTTLTITTTSNLNAGSYTFTVKASNTQGNKTTFVESTGTLIVTKTPLSVTANAAGKTYDGLAYSGGNGVAYSGFVNNETASVLGGTLAYSGTSQGAINVGPYVITPGGLTSNNYAITFNNGILTVGTAPLSVTANAAGKTYDGLAYSGGNGVAYSGFVNNETASVLGGTLAYSGTSQGAINVGPYVITPGGLTSNNYAITFNNGILTVGTAPLSVTANAAGKTYDGLAYSGGNGVAYSGFVNNETASVLGGTLAYSGTSQGAINVGPYVITPGGLTSNNYAITFNNGILTVGTAPLSVTANAAGKTYDGLAYSGGNGVAYSGFVNNETASVLGGTLAYSGTSQGAINVGPYVITPGGLTSNNYAITFNNGILTVGTAPLSVTANAAGKTYDGLAYSGGNGVAYSGFVNNETASVLGGTLAYSGTSQGAINVGPYVITPGGLTSNNYAITFNNGILTVGTAPLSVTANAAGKTYDGLAYSGGNGVAYSGFVNNETASVLGGTLAYSGTSQGAINVGPYVITPGGLTSNNYAITFNNGILTVGTAPLSVTANAAGKTYDGLAYSGGNGVAYSGFVNNETASVLGGTLAYSGTSQGAINVGPYVITPGGLTSNNYAITFNNGILTVGTAPLSVTANAAGKTYDGLAYSGGNGVAYSGFVNNETASVLGGTLAYSGTSQGAINVGPYVITPGGLTSNNYAITFNNGILTVGTAPLSVTANAAGKTYDGLAYSGGNGVAYSGFVNNETASVLGGTLAYSGTSQGAINVGSYVITPGGLTSNNYAITFNNGILTIDCLSIDAGASNKTVAVSTTFALSAKITPPAAGITVNFYLDDSSTPIGTGITTSPDGIATCTVTGGLPTEVYLVRAVPENNCQSSTAYLAVYDPNGGFVTGGGWINSPAGAYVADKYLTGKANFGFNAKYKKGNNEVDGNTEFQFQTGNLNFKSSSHDDMSLVIAGAQAIYKGKGTINGIAGYSFMVSVVDGDKKSTSVLDKFRIKIWNTGGVVYDNQIGQADNVEASTVLGGGSIVIHEVKKNTSKIAEKESIATPEILQFKVIAYPNPSNYQFSLAVTSDSNEKVEVLVYNMSARLVKRIEKSNEKTILFGEDLPAGEYLVLIRQGENQKAVNVIKK
ncbi:MBG domain-containing protein [Flavobacterium gilvum]|uniref:Secretion system C-terminal sorting domain-containing protein n=1 Tax=Flavobacterium gilvum TaxID=1492737 RepID=A0AAC9N652_9FLAO|nr:MBG domain-containing protein [Flavobacterium gilvum]AOW10017.1 hypothetical protein EM308_11130 [Flavobacterium gilvum]